MPTVLVSSLSAAFAYVSPDLISDLDKRIRLDLQSLDDRFFWWVMASAFVVVIGCAMEGPEIFHELWPEVFAVFSGRWVKKVGLVGWLFVVLGVAGEGVFEVLEYQAQGLLQTFNDILLADAQRSAGSARASAIEAANAANRAHFESEQATASSANASALAQGARKEADAFAQDIKSAKQQAADAEQHLADALRQAAAATEELNRMKTPRSLTNAASLIPKLQEFKGTEYQFVGVFQDQESFNLLKEIDSLLQLAGWTRGKFPMIGGLSVNIDKDFQVPPILLKGVFVEVDSTETLEDLQARPQVFVPSYIRAAMTLKPGLASTISPVQEDLSNKLGVNAGKPTAAAVVFIAVGSKP